MSWNIDIVCWFLHGSNQTWTCLPAFPLEQDFYGEGGSGEGKAGCLLQQSLHGSHVSIVSLDPVDNFIIPVLAFAPF